MRLGLGGPSHLQAPAQTDLPTFLPVDIISSGQSQPKLYSQPPVSPGKNSSPRGPGPEIQECYCIHSRTYTHTHTHLTHTLTHPKPCREYLYKMEEQTRMAERDPGKMKSTHIC